MSFKPDDPLSRLLPVLIQASQRQRENQQSQEQRQRQKAEKETAAMFEVLEKNPNANLSKLQPLLFPNVTEDMFNAGLEVQKNLKQQQAEAERQARFKKAGELAGGQFAQQNPSGGSFDPVAFLSNPENLKFLRNQGLSAEDASDPSFISSASTGVQTSPERKSQDDLDFFALPGGGTAASPTGGRTDVSGRPLPRRGLAPLGKVQPTATLGEVTGRPGKKEKETDIVEFRRRTGPFLTRQAQLLRDLRKPTIANRRLKVGELVSGPQGGFITFFGQVAQNLDVGRELIGLDPSLGPAFERAFTAKEPIKLISNLRKEARELPNQLIGAVIGEDPQKVTDEERALVQELRGLKPVTSFQDLELTMERSATMSLLIARRQLATNGAEIPFTVTNEDGSDNVEGLATAVDILLENGIRDDGRIESALDSFRSQERQWRGSGVPLRVSGTQVLNQR